MIYLTDKEKEKIILIDKIFSCMSEEYLQEIANGEEIVARLKDELLPSTIVQKLANECEQLSFDVQQNRIDISTMKADMQLLVKTINQTTFSVPYISDFNTLKSKLGIY